MLPSGVQLAQSRPSGTSAVTAIAGRKRKQITVTRIVVANRTSGSADYSIYHDDDGATFSDDTVLFSAIPLPGNTTEMITLETAAGSGIVVSESGQIGIKTSVGSALTFTLYGIDGVRT